MKDCVNTEFHDFFIYYEIVISQLADDNIIHTLYGIQIIKLNHRSDTLEQATAPGITTHRAAAERILAKMKKQGVTPCTLYDIIDDCLS